jgi:hypothetical protein
MTTPYLVGHFNALTGHVGSVGQNVTANVGNRLGGSRGHFLVVATRLGMTGALWSVAFAGTVRGLRRRSVSVPAVLLALAPFPLVILQGYGGEMFMRVYLFALPFMCFLAAGALLPRAGSGARVAGLAFASFVLAVGCLVTRYGNERMDVVTQSELHAAEHLYRIAPPGSVLLAWTSNVAWKFRGYDNYRYRIVTETPEWRLLNPERPDMRTTVRLVATLMAQDRRSSYLIITRAEIAEADLLGLSPPGTLVRLERALTHSPQFTLAYRNPDATIFRLRGAGGPA